MTNTLLLRLLPLAAALLVALAAPGALYASETEWQLEEEEDGISIYTREVEGSPYIAVKAVTEINVSAAELSELMGTGNGCVEWRAMCKSSKVIETVSEHELYVYMVLDLPWPISDRDLVLHTTTEIDPDTQSATVHLQSASAKHPEQDIIRAETQGRYIIRIVDPQRSEFTYIMHTELGGDLSPGMVNPRVTDGAREDLERLKKLAEK